MRIFTLIPILLLSFASHAQFMQVDGKFLKDVSGNKTILRGINYPIMDDGSVDLNSPASYQPKIDEFAKTGANCIRIPWNTDGVHWRDQPGSGGAAGTMQGYIDNGKLGALIDYCYTKNLVVILEIHDLTCANDWAGFNNIVADFWLNENVLDLINTHQSGLILNIANEFGYDGDWGGDINIFKTQYISAIEAIRDAGIQVPIMIDAPDCGMASSSLVSIAGDLLAGDENLIFSVHSYWTAYANTDAEIDAKMDEMNGSPGCFLFGEIANKQDVDGICGSTDISHIYQRVLTNACPMEIGWLAWSYHKDCAPEREMTNDGTFADLTAYGDDLINNTGYGLKSAGPCSGSAGLPTGFAVPGLSHSKIEIYPNPNSGTFFLGSDKPIQEVQAYDATGRKIVITQSAGSRYRLTGTPSGLYHLKCILKDGTIFSKTISCIQ